MTDSHPVTLLCGEDEFAIDEFVAKHVAKIGSDPTIASLNTSHLDGRSHSYDDLVKAVHAMPFMLDHRLVLFNHPTSLIKHPSHQKKFIELIEQLPATTLLILIEDHDLTSAKDRKNGKTHWLEKWARASGKRAEYRAFPVPTGAGLNQWVLNRAEKLGGKFTQKASDELILRTGPIPRMLDQEIVKLLTYVNYKRPVEPEDVQQITPFTAPVPSFALLNALRDRNAGEAFGLLRRELEEKEPILVFFNIVNQFRQVIQARDILDQGGRAEDLARLLRMHPYAAEQAMKHATLYSAAQLEAIYHRLLELDEKIKTGQLNDELALDLLLEELTGASQR
ncbi:MAG: DNA polymerase III subunit delta [Anaerolineales bacterium]|nr:DNA polymerase III subunit delta [Anaerolineales bacterium]